MLDGAGGVAEGDGPPPDIVMISADTAGHLRCCTVIARWILSGESTPNRTSLGFDPDDVQASAGKVAWLTRDVVRQVAFDKWKVHRSRSRDDREASAKVVVAVRIDTERVRHEMSLLVREALRTQLRELCRKCSPAALKTQLLWVDYLGPGVATSSP